ncbi:MAG: hypothetical protein KY445_13135 [Armatimonadetes bacterium]|nr:hypothetical protein [Armatimonadota bacterium]
MPSFLEVLVSVALYIAPLILLALIARAKTRWKWLILALYPAIYLPFSLAGRFEGANHGGRDWRVYWCPRGLMEPYRKVSSMGNRQFKGRQKVRHTPLGTFFWPLIGLDNLLWHRPPKHELAE